MRLGALLLMPAALAAQSKLPWDVDSRVPWESTLPSAAPAPLSLSPGGGDTRTSANCRVMLTEDGTLRISDHQGRILFRLGLPGRPVRVLRDAGTPMALTEFPAFFPTRNTPLTEGLGGLPLVGGDFRPALEGLLWILDDGEQRITLVHPATERVVYLPLPTGQGWEIHLQPDRLEIREKAPPAGERRETACWSVPWLVLLPQFVRLSVPQPVGNRGTAFHPFPGQ